MNIEGNLQVASAATRTEASDDLACSPHFLSVNSISLLLEVFPVCLSGSVFECSLCFATIPDTLVELLKDGFVGVLEDGCPVFTTSERNVTISYEKDSPIKSTSSGGSRASSEHVVHSVLCYEGVETHEGCKRKEMSDS